MFDSFTETLKTGVVNMFGTSATYTPVSGDSVSCSVEINFESELRPDSLEFEIVEIGTTIEALVSDVGSPKQGSTFLVDGVTYKVKRTDSNDKTFVKVVVNED